MSDDRQGAGCPLPRGSYPRVVMAHGGGGRLMHQLVRDVFLEAFGCGGAAEHDGAVVTPDARRIAITTDSYVVQPLFFPGGDIGTLAVNGTVNDLAMCGARPRWLSAGFILEEGLPTETLERVARSMAAAAGEAGVALVTGDTKVVEKGKADGMFICTTGVGTLDHDSSIGPASVREGDAIILSGDVGLHGMAVMAARESLGLRGDIRSDCASLAAPVMALLQAGIEVHCLRDLTRGGLATCLVEIAEAAGLRIQVLDGTIPVSDAVSSACEVLGLDPLYVANEGRFVAFLPRGQAGEALRVLASHPVSRGACVIGEVQTSTDPVVVLQNRLGTGRILDMLSGEQLPRIC